MIRTIFLLSLLILLSFISCEKSVTQIERLIKDIKTNDYFMDKDQCEDKLKSLLDSSDKTNMFAVLIKVPYTENKQRVDLDYFIRLISKYEKNLENIKLDLIALKTNESSESLYTEVFIIGQVQSFEAIEILEKEYSGALILKDSEDIKKMINKFKGRQFNLKTDEKSFGNVGEIALWLLLLLIFGPIVIVIFIVLACFKWICGRGHHGLL